MTKESSPEDIPTVMGRKAWLSRTLASLESARQELNRCCADGFTLRRHIPVRIDDSDVVIANGLREATDIAKYFLNEIELREQGECAVKTCAENGYSVKAVLIERHTSDQWGPATAQILATGELEIRDSFGNVVFTMGKADAMAVAAFILNSYGLVTGVGREAVKQGS